LLLKELMAELEVSHVEGNLDIEINGVAYDSRKVQPGFLFVAVKGFVVDGHDYISQAIENGASAVVVEKVVTLSVPTIGVFDSRIALAQVAAKFYDYPANKLTLAGVTGTNGKTTTTYLIAAIYKAAGNKVGLVGTIQNLVGGKETPSANTTPESLDLQQLFSNMVNAGVTHATMEVSSHALALNRTYGVAFDAAVFTNITQDHLDFHQDMDDYARAKSKLFANAPLAIINADDGRAKEMVAASKGAVVTYGIHQPADVGVKDIQLTARGVSFTTTGKYGEHKLNLKLTGEFNVYNALAAFALGLAQGFDVNLVVSALEGVAGVAGRFELVDCGQPFAVVVDYAHTPDGLENVLTAAKAITTKRLISVFGCGGDRDRTKRPIMGEIGTRYSDLAVITSDNPRTEEPDQIITEVLAGVQRASSSDHSYKVLVDRRQAIKYAIEEAKPGDVVVIAGKGHETYQIIGKTKYDFDDRLVAAEALENLGHQG
jgi:UDP-N-acetylmuramoyl-L-alanyl-D-glutamate--2,6-diaminopimelate ligase